MTTEAARLQISVGTSGVKGATSELDRLARKGGEAESATSSLTRSIGGIVGRAAAGAAAIAGITMSIGQLVATTREFEKLRAGLTTATGSKQLGEEAFSAIKDFATKTPYDLGQVTTAFTKLVNLGLTPSERALYSYGNTASSLGKSLSDMVEAVADASTGEFERLKEFGIKASKEGDQITFRFRGVSTTVRNEASAIEDYLIRLGEVNFGEGMKNQMETLDGSMSNFADGYAQMLDGIARMGVGDIIKETVDKGVDALGEINAMLESGEMQAHLESIGIAWSGWGQDILRTIVFVDQHFKQHSDDTSGLVDFMVEAFRRLPQNVRAFLQIMVTELAGAVDRAKAYGQALFDALNAPWGQGMSTLSASLDARLKAVDQNVDASIAAILEERDATVKAGVDKVAAARAERAELDRLAAAKRNAGVTGDRLTRYKVGGTSKQEPTDAAKKAADQAKKDFERLVESLRTEEEAIAISYQERNNLIIRHTKDGSASRIELMRRSEEQYQAELGKMRDGTGLDKLVESLRSEEEQIAQSYAARLTLIRKNTEEGSALRADLEARAYADYQKKLGDANQGRRAPVDQIREQLLSEEQALTESYERRAQIVRDSEMLTMAEKQNIMMTMTQDYLAKQQAMESQRTSMALTSSGQMFDGLAGIAEQYAGKQSGMFKALFAASKAFAIADAMVKIQQAMASAAMSLPFPGNLGAMATVAAATGSIVSTITGVNFNGGGRAYDSGGMIPAGKKGLVGEFGPELVEGPAIVTSRRQTAAKVANSGNNGTGAVSVVVYNNSGVKAETRETTDSRGNRRIEVAVGEMVGGEMKRQGSAANSAMRTGFNVEPRLIRR